VFEIAVALLVIGLPIMLATGRKERQRVIAASTGTFPIPDTPVTKHLTWRKAILGGALAFGALTAIVIAYSAMRAMGIGSIGTLQAKGLIKERQPILLADFESRAADTTLGPTLTEAFRVDLSQSKTVKLVDGQAVSDALVRMQKPASTTMKPALALEVAQREGIPAVVAGQIDAVGKSYVLSVRVLSAADGAALTAVRETATGDADLIPALDRLSRALRERIGESLVSIRTDQPLQHVTTGSLDALRKYTQAVRLSDTGDEEGAIPLLREAVAIDTGFAMAWRKLSSLISNNGGSTELSAAAATRAYQHRDRLPELEKQAATASYFDFADHDPQKAILAYRAMLTIDPDNDIALNNLSFALTNTGQYAEGESLAVRCMNRGQFANCPFHAVRAQLLQRRLPAAESTLTRWRRASPNDPNARWVAIGIASWRGDYEAADERSRELAESQKGSPYWLSVAAHTTASIAGVEGKIARAEEQMRHAADLNESRGALDQYLIEMMRLARFDFRSRNHAADAIALVDSALAKHPLATMDANDRPYSEVAITYALLGRIDEAQRLVSERDRAVSPGMEKGDPDRFTAAGQIAFAQGRYAEAVTAFQASLPENLCTNCGLFNTAFAYAKLNQPDSARVYYERYINEGGTFRIFGDANFLPASYQRLGEIYEAKGDRKRAVEYYGKLVALWKNADPELQPIVKDAKERVARLSGER
jgi:eukaryotic-like serine/threonine-protein kinase